MATFEFLYGESAEHFRFLRIPKALLEDKEFRQLPHFLEDLIVYSQMLDLASLSKKKGLVDEENRVYIVCQNDEVQQWLDVGVNMPTKVIAELERFGLIKRRRRSQDSMYYVMDFANKIGADSEEKLEVPEVQKQKRKRKSPAKTVNHKKCDSAFADASITENVNHEKRESRDLCFTKSVDVNHGKRVSLLLILVTRLITRLTSSRLQSKKSNKKVKNFLKMSGKRLLRNAQHLRSQCLLNSGAVSVKI